MLSLDYIQPNRRRRPAELIDYLVSAFASALGHFHPFVGRLAMDEHADDGAITVPLLCMGEGAEFVHVAALASRSTKQLASDVIVKTIMRQG
jgi:glutamate-1-semialdehyde aminotransferase